MKTRLGVRNALFAAPLLASFAVWSLASSHAGAAPASDVAAAVAPQVATLEVAAPAATSDEFLFDEVLAEAEDLPTEVTDDAAAMVLNNCTYYNNASHTMVVGQFGYDCCNNPVAWGKKTKFSECGGCFLCVPPPQ